MTVTSKPARVSHTFFVPLSPMPAPRHRCLCRGKFPTATMDPKYRAWRAELLPLLKEAARYEDFREVREAPVRIILEVIRTKPRTSKLAAPLGDNDQYEKGIWDGITETGKWWADDKQIVENLTTKRWAKEGEPEGYLVRIEFL